MEPAGPVLVAHRFAALHAELMALLRGLGPEDWARPTWAPLWDVRDVVAHLLDGDVRRLSLHRDALAAPPAGRAVAGYRDLVAYLDELNADWVRTARRISPAVLLDLLAVTGPQVAHFLRGLDQHGPAHFPVAWAGEDASANWLDVGREYTERWHHQQQIREAVGAPGLLGRAWLGPVLEISMRALPFAYRDVGGAPGAAVVVIVEGESGGAWSLVRRPAGWGLFVGDAGAALARVRMSEDTAWRLFFRLLPGEEARGRVRTEGNQELGAVALDVAALMV